ncbi:hypothetical protein ZWY2020_017270 [Hordeum vulgare]|nr:hypothetical protein ZWY2020_017270 [Hordeum vulgare]
MANNAAEMGGAAAVRELEAGGEARGELLEYYGLKEQTGVSERSGSRSRRGGMQQQTQWRADATVTANQTDSTFDEELKLVGMGFERVLAHSLLAVCTQAQVALAAAEDDPNVAIEILMSQQD